MNRTLPLLASLALLAAASGKKKPRGTNAAGLYRSGPSALRMNPLQG